MYPPHPPCSCISCNPADAAVCAYVWNGLFSHVYTFLYSFIISALSVYQDFDQDDYLGKEDLKQTLRAITANELTDEEMEFVSDKV